MIILSSIYCHIQFIIRKRKHYIQWKRMECLWFEERSSNSLGMHYPLVRMEASASQLFLLPSTPVMVMCKSTWFSIYETSKIFFGVWTLIFCGWEAFFAVELMLAKRNSFLMAASTSTEAYNKGLGAWWCLERAGRRKKCLQMKSWGHWKIWYGCLPSSNCSLSCIQSYTVWHNLKVH